MSIGRKATLAWAAFLMSNIWLYLDKFDGSTYVTLVSLVFGMYSGANVLRKRNGST